MKQGLFIIKIRSHHNRIPVEHSDRIEAVFTILWPLLSLVLLPSRKQGLFKKRQILRLTIPETLLLDFPAGEKKTDFEAKIRKMTRFLKKSQF